MTHKHARIASAVANAMLAKNFTTKQVATFAGCTSSAISSALSGKYDLREERWRLICENLGLDYDEIIKDPEPELPPSSPRGESTSIEREARTAPDAEIGGVHPFPLAMNRRQQRTSTSMRMRRTPSPSLRVTWPCI